MFLVYIDEYGDTGSRLNDPNQPLFGLVAALIPDRAWVRLETSLSNLALEIRKTLALDETPRLHMVDLYQRKGVYRYASIDQCFTWIERVFEIARKAQVQYHGRIVKKAERLKEFQDSPLNTWSEAASRGEAPFDLYVGHFPHLLLDLDGYCEQRDEHVILFVDQHERTRHLDTLTIYRAWRYVDILKRTLEAPIQRDSRHHTLLALPDFAGYVLLGTELDKLRRKERPKLKDWASRFVLPNVIDYQPSKINLKRALAVTNFFFSESDKEDDLSRAIMGLEAGLDSLDS